MTLRFIAPKLYTPRSNLASLWLPLFLMITTLPYGLRAETAPIFGGQGKIECEYTDASGKVTHRETATYEFAVSNQQWGIRLDAPASDIQAICDGTNVFQFRFLSPRHEVPSELLQRYSIKKPETATNAESPLLCELIPGHMAMGTLLLNLPWLANCSAGQIQTSGLGDLPPPWEVISDSVRAFAYISTGSVLKESHKLPEMLTWRYSNDRARTAAFDVRITRELTKKEERADQGKAIPFGDPEIVEGEYKVLSTVTMDGFRIPQDYQLTRSCRTKLNQEKPTLILRATGHQTVTANPDMALLSVPHAADGYFVVDHRFRHESRLVDFIQYRTNNPKRASSSDPYLLDAYSRKVSTAHEDPARLAR